MSKKYRLVTRSDMDGLVCAVLLKQLDMIALDFPAFADRYTGHPCF